MGSWLSSCVPSGAVPDGMVRSTTRSVIANAKTPSLSARIRPSPYAWSRRTYSTSSSSSNRRMDVFTTRAPPPSEGPDQDKETKEGGDRQGDHSRPGSSPDEWKLGRQDDKRSGQDDGYRAVPAQRPGSGRRAVVPQVQGEVMQRQSKSQASDRRKRREPRLPFACRRSAD